MLLIGLYTDRNCSFASLGMPQVISANRLIDGIVIYGGRDGAWADALGAAKIFTSKAERRQPFSLPRMM